jgi:mannose-6-phosphate isomerase-like protein (cupin superfamily)
MKPIDGYVLIKPEDLAWRPSNQMLVPNADILERTGSQLMGARFWRLPPKSANTYHKHIKAEELYFVLEGTGRIRIGEDTLTVPKHGSVLVGPAQMRQIFNDTDSETLWLIIGSPDNELEPGEAMDMKRFWPVDPKQLPKELAGAVWPPVEPASPTP